MISTKILTVIAIAYHQSPSVSYVDSNRIRFIQSAKARSARSAMIYQFAYGGGLLRDILGWGQGVRELEEEGEWQRQ